MLDHDVTRQAGRVAWVLALGLLGSTMSCTGAIGSLDGEDGIVGGQPGIGGAPGSGGSGPAGPPPASAGSGSSGSGGTQIGGPSEAALSGGRLRLLTASQYRATLKTLFPFADELALDLEPDVALNGLRAIGASTVSLSSKATEMYRAAAQLAVDRAFEDTASGSSFVGCDVADSSCEQRFIRDFARRAFRRPPSAEESARFDAIYEAGKAKLGDANRAMKFAATAVLGSPHFIYRVEVGVDDPAAPGKRTLTDIEVASKLAYFLWDAPPDSQLLDVAVAGGLGTSATLRAQAERLLASPAARAGMRTFFDDYLNLSALASVDKDSRRFSNFTPALAAAMREETLRNLESAAEAGDFRSVFNSGKTFVNGELARFYGIPGISGASFAEATFPASVPRRGLLGNASVLSLYAHASVGSATLRGKFVREALLCEGIPAPPPGVITTLPDSSQAPTAREKLTIHRTDPTCASCHAKMDPIGLSLENFDAVGAYRATDDGHPIDASGELDGTTFSGPAGLADALAAHPKVPECVSRTVFRYAWGRLETRGDEAFIASMRAGFERGGFRLRQLLLEVVTAPDFRRTGPLD